MSHPDFAFPGHEWDSSELPRWPNQSETGERTAPGSNPASPQPDPANGATVSADGGELATEAASYERSAEPSASVATPVTVPLTPRLYGTAKEFFDYAERASDAAGIGMVMSPHFTAKELEEVGHLLTEAADAIVALGVELAYSRQRLGLSLRPTDER